MIHVSEITYEQKQEFVEHLSDGLDAHSAAALVGTTGTQFRKLRNPEGVWYDAEFARDCDEAEANPRRAQTQRERLEGAFWLQVEKGNWNAILKGLLLYHPEWEPLRHTNLRVTGQIDHMLALVKQLPSLTDEQLREMLEADDGPVALLEAGE